MAACDAAAAAAADDDDCCKAEEEYQIEKGRLMQEQRAAVNRVYEKKKSQNELSRKVWDVFTCSSSSSSVFLSKHIVTVLFLELFTLGVEHQSLQCCV